jgi:hypothetical protein
MNLLDEIRKSNKKPKELLVNLSEKVKKDKKLLSNFSDCLKNASATEKGTLMETLEYASKDHPEVAIPHLNEVINHLSFDAPRVKWEAARVIANLSKEYPDKAAQAIDRLLVNTKDKGTVIRWSTAFAIGEITKFNKNKQKSLVSIIEGLAKKEQNNGVKNVYLKALKIIKKK